VQICTGGSGGKCLITILEKGKLGLVDKAKAKFYEALFLDFFIAGLVILFLLNIADLSTFDILRNVDFATQVITYLLLGLGLFLIVEALRSMPDTKRNSSRIGGYTVMGFGILSVVYGIGVLFGTYNPIGDSGAVNIILTIILIISLAFLLPNGFSKLLNKKGVLKAIAN